MQMSGHKMANFVQNKFFVHKMLICGHEMLICAHEILTWAYKIVIGIANVLSKMASSILCSQFSISWPQNANLCIKIANSWSQIINLQGHFYFILSCPGFRKKDKSGENYY